RVRLRRARRHLRHNGAGRRPLELPTQVLHAFIDGREIDLSNKQTKLRDKYVDKYRQLNMLDD
ncbi:MAG: hypothetical protein AAFU70_13910, partial [Planctomycetota bacterium]